MGVFGIRRVVLDAINKSWSTRWHRYWHRIALQHSLVKELASETPAAVIAQCPLSAQAAERIAQDPPPAYAPPSGPNPAWLEMTRIGLEGLRSQERAYRPPTTTSCTRTPTGMDCTTTSY